jgi:MFS transporter, MCT family, solute carrier family 16 (monocarboxylic acid transporters), member 3
MSHPSETINRSDDASQREANTDKRTEKPEGIVATVGDGGGQPVAPEDLFEYPDGGFEAWMQVLACHLVNALAWGFASAYGVYQLYYKQTTDLPSAQISWIGSIQVFLTFGSCVFSGRLADAGYIRSTVFFGSLLAVLGTFTTSLATEYWQLLLAQGICTGIGLGIIFVPGVSVINSYFKKNRSLALSLTATGTGTGSVVFPATIQYLTPKIGFPWAVRCSGFIALLFAGSALAILRPRLPPRKSGSLIEWEAFKEPPYVLFTSGCFLVYWAMYFGFFYVSSY